MTAPAQGRIASFYSYKGGTGRSMMLANLAWVLASNGRRVLAVDWDLEAPGLHRYLHPFLADPELRSTEGLIDMVTAYATRAVTPHHEPAAGTGSWYQDLAELTGYVFSIDYEWFPAGATLDLLPAGRQGPAYASRVNSFDWSTFYGRLGGGAFLEAVRQQLRSRYDYVLIDSRTGVSDTSGICTVQLPDVLVVCFTMNRQSIEGASAVAESVLAQRPDLRVLPVPCRIELAEKERLDSVRDYAYDRFRTALGSANEAATDDYWSSMEVLYQPFYAYEEVLAAFADSRRGPTDALGAVERLASRVTQGDVERSVPPPEPVRTEVLARFLRREPPATASAEKQALLDELARNVSASEEVKLTLDAVRRRSRRTIVLTSIVAVVAIAAAGITFIATRGCDGPPNDISVSGTTLGAFGAVAVGQGAAERLTVTRESCGKELTIEKVEIDESDGAFFVQDDSCTGVPLAEGEGCDVIIKFLPNEARDFSGHMHTSWDSDQSPDQLDLTGTGVDASA